MNKLKSEFEKILNSDLNQLKIQLEKARNMVLFNKNIYLYSIFFN
jgi:hypothetical protein